MSLASLKIIYTDQAQGGWIQSPLEGFFFRILKGLHLSHPFTPLTAKRETCVIAV